MRAAIAIDDWKRSIFERHLSDAGYKYEVGRGLTHGTLLLYIETSSVGALETVVVAANLEAAEKGKH